MKKNKCIMKSKTKSWFLMSNPLKLYNGSKTFFDVIKNREDFSTYQGNILAQCFGNLDERELDLVDYFLTFIKKTDVYDEEKIYQTSINEILQTMGIKNNGAAYKEFSSILKNMRDKTNVLVPFEEKLNGRIVRGYNYVSLFQDFIVFENADGKKSRNGFGFSFNKRLAPFLYGLEDGSFFVLNYKSLRSTTSKYERKLLGLWKSYQYGNAKKTVVKGSLHEWRIWLLGSLITEDENEVAKWPAAKVKSNAIMRGVEKLTKSHHVTVTVEPIKEKRNITGFILTFIEKNSKEILALKEIEDAVERGRVNTEKIEQYTQLIIERSISTSQSPLEAASDLLDTGIIEFIPPKIAGKG